MFKFKDYLNEAFNDDKFSKGDKVIYKGSSPQFSVYKNKNFVVSDVRNYGIKPYTIQCDDPGVFISFMVSDDDIILDAGKNEIEKGDSVLFKTTRPMNNRSNNKIGNVLDIMNNGENFRLSFPDGDIVVSTKNEVTKVDPDKPIVIKKPPIGERDNIIFNSNKEYLKKYNGKVGVVSSKSHWNYYVRFEGNSFDVYCDFDELTLIEVDFRIVIGSKVNVNGKQGTYLFRNRTGIVKKINRDKNGMPESYFIKFDGNESKNFREFSMMIDKEIVDYAGKVETRSDGFDEGDSVLCTKPGDYFNKVGRVSKVWNDGDYTVSFTGKVNVFIVMKPEFLKTSEADEFTKRLKEKLKTKEIPRSSEVEEEEEEDDVKITRNVEEEQDFEIDKEDLLSLSYDEFFLEDKLIDKREFIEKKKQYEDMMNKDRISEFKKDFYEKSLRLAELVEQYFDFLEAKVAEGRVVIRTLESIESEILRDNSTKVRASESREITKKYSFDSGIIVYWVFEDAVVFKTI